MLPQSTVALRVSRNYSKVRGLPETVEIQNNYCLSSPFFFLLSSFFSQPSTLMRDVTQLKQPLNMRIVPKDVTFALILKRNYLC